jgi:hypothetical protein
VGAAFAGQPVAAAICTRGIRRFSGAGSVGCVPTLDAGDVTGPVLVGPTDEQAPTTHAARIVVDE